MGALPHCPTAGAAGGPAAEHSGLALCNHHEAAREDGRGPLPDRSWGRARSLLLPCGLGGSMANRRIPARRARHTGPARHSGEALWASARDRDLARLLRPSREDGHAAARARFGLLGYRQVFRRQRAPQGPGAAARPLHLGQVRSVQTRHSLFNAGTGL